MSRRVELVSEAREASEAVRKSGVVYLSTVPPFMKVAKLRHIFSDFGAVKRLYLTPETASQRKARVHSGGSRKHKFLDGWIEFEDKKIAKAVAMSLNNTQIGGKRRSMYYEMIWNIKYLPGFKWHHLTEKIVYDRAVRDQRLQTEISSMKRETTAYLENVKKSKMQEFRKKREAEADLSALSSSSSSLACSSSGPFFSTPFTTNFAQRPVKRTSAGSFDSTLIAQVAPKASDAPATKKREGSSASGDIPKKRTSKRSRLE